MAKELQASVQNAFSFMKIIKLTDQNDRPQMISRKKRKHVRYSRTGVLTEKGRSVLSNDIHLYLQKLQQRKPEREAALDDPNCSDEKLNLLEKETERLEKKLAKHKEIWRLQSKLQQTSLSTYKDENPEYNEDKDLEYEESTESSHSKPHTLRRRTNSSNKVSQRTESTELITPEELARIQDDMA